jgi:hypothetical protein
VGPGAGLDAETKRKHFPPAWNRNPLVQSAVGHCQLLTDFMQSARYFCPMSIKFDTCL